VTRSHHSAGRRCGVALGASALFALVAGVAGAASGLWNITSIGAPASADGITIAVVDTGVDAAHPALAGRVLAQKDYVGDGRSGDPHGHGTHVAGTAAGKTIDCGGGAVPLGVAPTAQILPVRVLDEEGSGTMGDVAAGIRYAADRGAHVINLSLGPEVAVTNLVTGGGSLADAIEYAWSKGSVPVLAAGNDAILGAFGSGYGDIPAVVVTATTRAKTKASYATGVGSARWGIAAPGGDGSDGAGDILSAFPKERCAYMAGTSMAAPHVAGAVAALRARGLSPRQSVDRLLATADDLGSPSTYGAGLLNLGRALDGLGGAPAPTPAAAPAPTPASPTAPTPAGDATTTDDEPRSDSPGQTPSTEAGPTTTEPGVETTTTAAERTTTTRDASDETAAGTSQIRDDRSGEVGAPLAVGAGAAVLALWALTGRRALLLRR
jgi:subtilisin family serine protease